MSIPVIPTAANPMDGVIYDGRNGAIVKRYKTFSAAKSALTRMSRKKDVSNLIACNMATYTETGEKIANEMVTVKNLMSGLPTQIRRELVGTCCDPSTERYWCM